MGRKGRKEDGRGREKWEGEVGGGREWKVEGPLSWILATLLYLMERGEIHKVEPATL